MALIKCKECGIEISTEAKACPQCGANPPRSIGPVGWVLAGLFGVVLFQCASPKPPAPPLTAAQKEQKAREEESFRKTLIMAAAIKKALRDPESLIWERILANDDASVMCFEYRAKNGFGGMNREYVAVANGTASQTATAWNKHCAGKQLTNMTYVKHALK